MGLLGVTGSPAGDRKTEAVYKTGPPTGGRRLVAESGEEVLNDPPAGGEFRNLTPIPRRVIAT
jgi:hypothetical protein